MNKFFGKYVMFLSLISVLVFLITVQLLKTNEPVICLLLSFILVHLVCEKPFKIFIREQQKVEELAKNNK